MVLKWLSKWFDCYDSSSSIVYSKEQWDQNLKEKIIKFEYDCEQLGMKFQEKYKDQFLKKGLVDFQVIISRGLDGDKFDYLTSQDCFEEMYDSTLVVRYDGDKKLLIHGKDSDQAVVESIWE